MSPSWEFTFTLPDMERAEAEEIFYAAVEAVYERTKAAIGYFTQKDDEDAS